MKCIECKKEFEPGHYLQQICSDNCRRLRGIKNATARKQRLSNTVEKTIYCSECGERFKTRARKFTCGDTCSIERNIRLKREKHQAAREFKEITIKNIMANIAMAFCLRPPV